MPSGARRTDTHESGPPLTGGTRGGRDNPSFYRAFTITTYLLVLVGALSMTAAEGSLFLFVLTATVLAIIYPVVEVRGYALVSGLKLNLILFLVFLYLIFDWLAISNNMLVSFAHFLLIIQLLKLAQKKTDRDYLQIYMISMLHLTAAGMLTSDILFVFALVAYAVCATWALMLFHLKRAGESIDRLVPDKAQFNPVIDDRDGRVHIAGKVFFASSVVWVFVGMLMTAVIFTAIPRLSRPLFPALGVPATSGITGLTDIESFGEISRIIADDTEVLKIEFTRGGPAGPANLYLRTGTYREYIDGRWLVDRGTGSRAAKTLFASNGIYTLCGSEPGTRTEYTVMLEPLGNDALPLIPEPLAVGDIAHSPAALDAYYRQGFSFPINVSFKERTDRATQYSGISDSYRPPKYHLAECYAVDNFDGHYTVLSSEYDYSKVKNLAKKIISGVPNSAAPKDFDKVCAIERYLAENYDYSLARGKAAEGKDPVEHLLFGSKKGHCEYFATAMAVLLRTLNIDCRVATGLRGGNYNPIGDFYTVRKSNAHMWVEVFFIDPGTHEGWWVRFDPTPAYDPGDERWYDGVLAFKQFVRLSWQRWVLNFSSSHQRAVVAKIENATDQVRDSARRIPRGAAGILATIADRLKLTYVMLLVIGCAAGYLFWRSKVRALPAFAFWRLLEERKPEPPLEVGFYTDILKALARRRHTRFDFETPAAFAKRLAERHGAGFEPFIEVTELYYEARYSGNGLDAASFSRAAELCERIRAAPAN